MKRRSFFKKLILGAAVIATAPKILAARKPYVKPEATIMGPREMLDMQKSLMDSIMNMPIPPYGSFQKPTLMVGEDGYKTIEQAFMEAWEDQNYRRILETGEFGPPYKTQGIIPYLHKKAKWNSVL